MEEKHSELLEIHPSKCSRIRYVIRHPLFVSTVSIFLGGVGLNWIQSHQARQEADASKREALVDDIVLYTSRCGAVLRGFENLIELRNKIGDNAEERHADADLQLLIDSTYELESSTEKKIVLYYGDNEKYEAFNKFRKVYGDALNSGILAVKGRKSDWDLNTILASIAMSGHQVVETFDTKIRLHRELHGDVHDN
jgi:hypothetical protein